MQRRHFGFPDAAAQVQAVGIVQKVVGGEIIVADKLKYVAMELTGAGLGYYADLPAAGAPELRRVTAALHLEFRDRVHTRSVEQREVRPAVDVVRSIHCPRAGSRARPIDSVRDGGSRSRRCRDSDVKLIHRR